MTDSTRWTAGFWALYLLAASSVGCSREAKYPAFGRTPADSTITTPHDDQLIVAMRESFRDRNPRIEQIGVLDLKAWDFIGPRVVLGWGIVKDHNFRGDFNDEMFGVFVVDESLMHIQRVVDMFATPSWYDCEVRFTRFTADSVGLVGQDIDYGGTLIQRRYKWR